MGFSRKYDRAIMESEEGKRLYTYWYKTVSKNTDSPEFLTFIGFYKWAMDSGYSAEANLFRLNANEPYNPDNCVWDAKRKTVRVDQEFMKKWDDAVNRIRQHYGMEPIYSTGAQYD